MKIKDQLNRTLIFENTPKKIISLVPSQTELLVDLGLEKSIVGVTKFCVHPKHIRKMTTVVGGTKNVNYKKIKALEPDIIICNKEENTQHIVSELEKITRVYVSDILTINDSLQFILDVGSIFNLETNAEQLVKAIQNKLHEFNLFISTKPNKKVAYFIWRDPWMVVGSNTFINELLELNNFKNVFESEDRYPQIKIESLKKLDLDLVLLSSEPYPFKEKHINEIKEYTNAKIALVDGEYFSWHGSRLLKASDYFKTLH